MVLLVALILLVTIETGVARLTNRFSLGQEIANPKQLRMSNADIDRKTLDARKTAVVGFGRVLPASAITSAPLSSPSTVSTDFTPRHLRLAAWGESLAEEHLKFRGYEVHDPKRPGGQGIDRIAIRRDASGRIAEVRIIEVKTRSTGARARLGMTNTGQQLSNKWIAHNLNEMRRSRDISMRSLAEEIIRYRKQTGIRYERMAELYHIVAQDQVKLTRFNPVTNRIIPDLPIDQKALSNFVRKNPVPVSGGVTKSVVRTGGRTLAILGRATIPVTVIGAGVFDIGFGAYGIYDTQRRFRLGELDADIRIGKLMIGGTQISVGAAAIVGGILLILTPEPIITTIAGVTVLVVSAVLVAVDYIFERLQAQRTTERWRLAQQIDASERYHFISDELRKMI